MNPPIAIDWLISLVAWGVLALFFALALRAWRRAAIREGTYRPDERGGWPDEPPYPEP
jgi:hypothetical protein